MVPLLLAAGERDMELLTLPELEPAREPEAELDWLALRLGLVLTLPLSDLLPVAQRVRVALPVPEPV